MNIDKILQSFGEGYILIDSNTCTVTSLFPKHDDFTSMPYEEFVLYYFSDLSQEDNNKVLSYLFKKNKTKNINITIKKKIYSLEYKIIDKKEFVHICNCNKAINAFKEEVTLDLEDPLSGLLHKIAFKSYIEQQIESNPNLCGTLFMIDIDYFKNINDNYGHMFGDEVIKEASASLKTISEKATVGRLGGDEFAIFIEDDLDREAVKNYARLIRYLLGRIIINKESYPITATIGIAQYPKNGVTFDELYECSDKALYRGKMQGRDCHIIYDPSLHENGRSNNSVLTKVSYATGSVTSFIHQIVNDLLVDNLCLNDVVEISKDIVEYFNIDRIVVSGFDKVYTVFEKEKTKDPNEYYSKLDLQKYYKLFKYNNSFIVNDIYTLKSKDENTGNLYIDAGINSFIQVLIMDAGKVVGFVSYEVLNGKRVWQVGEINNLVIISNIINSFLIKNKIGIK